ncbi:splicing factor [Mytilinidion resinicola]|uniref:LSM2-LSM8 complex subunit LSM8 n=1 Tax=Mytilinidion resinicola TaxID=574789 RepID=A0A6A6Y4H7_9PEZI|nr:splicing factor [Mytilinidion resinicola]KAF2803135.1 splicing factor [Mytilinidion resinicola]
MSLNSYLNKKVCVITSDGRTLVGTLISCDQNTNLVLQNTIERIIATADSGEKSSQTEQGLYMIRGDSVVVCGEVDEEIDASINWEEVKGEGIGGTKHV